MWSSDPCEIPIVRIKKKHTGTVKREFIFPVHQKSEKEKKKKQHDPCESIVRELLKFLNILVL